MKKLTVIFLCLLLASTALGCGKKNGIRATYAGNINTYCEMKDGTWSCNDRSYEYRLERRGRCQTRDVIPCLCTSATCRTSPLSRPRRHRGLAATQRIILPPRTPF